MVGHEDSFAQVAGGILNDCPLVLLVDMILAIAKFVWIMFCGSAAWAIMGNTENNTFWVGCGLLLLAYWGLQAHSCFCVCATFSIDIFHHETILIRYSGTLLSSRHMELSVSGITVALHASQARFAGRQQCTSAASASGLF